VSILVGVCVCNTDITITVSRSTYDLLLGRVAGHVAASPGFGTLPTQTAVPPVVPKTEIMDSPVQSIAPMPPTGVSGTSGALVSAPTLAPQLNHADYPHVVFWYEDKYNILRKGGKRGGEDEPEEHVTGSVLSSYMEQEDGNGVPKSTRNAARKRARAVFLSLLKDGTAPSTWGSAPFDVQLKLISTLETEFPFLRLCENHWKATMVATNSYSQWYGSASGRKAAAKARREVINVDADADDDGEKSSNPAQTEDNDSRPSKRPRLAETQPPPHPRSEETQPTPPSRPIPKKIGPQRQKVRKSFTIVYTFI
jgi:hypothetical protein